MSNDDKMSAQVTVRNMKMTPMEDRPREKALAHGLETLSNAELLATLLGSGVPGVSVVELCEQILYDNDNKLYRLARHSVKDLMRYHGVGEVKALNMLAALELGRRMADEEFEQLPSITDSQKAFRYLRNKMASANYERLCIVILDHAKHVINFREISDGGKTATVADIKRIMRTAIEYDADSIILAHNHPSNNPKPSPQDDALTQKVAQAGKLVDIPLIDHIIVTQGECYSYMEHGKL